MHVCFWSSFFDKMLFNSLGEYIIGTNMKKMRKIVIVLLGLCLVLLTLSFPLVNAIEDSWETMEPMPTARSGLGVAVVDGKIYAIGGYNGSYLGTNEMYDPKTNGWTAKTSMPTPRCNFAITAYQNKIYVIGGEISQGIVGSINEVYDPLTDTWETKTGLPNARSLLCANVVNNKIYLIGGLGTGFPPWVCTQDTFVYDPDTDSWVTKAPIPTPISDYASAVIDNKLYVIGGRDIGNMVKYDETHIYDTQTDNWSNGTSSLSIMPSPNAGVTTGELAPKRIHVMYADSHYIYDPEKDEWTTAIPMLTSRYNVGVAVVDDLIYVIGGYDGENYRNENEKYTPQGYIPEFPSWIIVPLFIIAAVAVIIYRKKLTKKYRVNSDAIF